MAERISGALFLSASKPFFLEIYEVRLFCNHNSIVKPPTSLNRLQALRRQLSSEIILKQRLPPPAAPAKFSKASWRTQALEDVAQKDYEREAAAECVIITETEQLATAHLAKLAALRKAHYILANLTNKYVKRDPSERIVGAVPGHLYGSGGVRKVRMPGVVVNAASQDILGDSERSGGFWVRDAVTKAVNDYWAALKNDATATLNDEPSPPEEKQHEAAE